MLAHVLNAYQVRAGSFNTNELYLIIPTTGPPYKLKAEQKECEFEDDTYTAQWTATVDDCYKICKQQKSDHFSYGRKETWACRREHCKCWCFLADECVEKDVRHIDLYVVVQGAYNLK